MKRSVFSRFPDGESWKNRCRHHSWSGYSRKLKVMPIPNAQAPAHALTIIPRNSLWVRFWQRVYTILGTRLW